MGAEPAETGDVGASDPRVSAHLGGIYRDMADPRLLANGELLYSAVRASKQYCTVSGTACSPRSIIAFTTRTSV